MELGDVEIFMDARFNKHLLVKVECVKASLHGVEGLQSVQLELSIVNEVSQSSDDLKYLTIDVRSPSNHGNKDALHLFVLSTCPLGNKRHAFFEMP